MTALTAIGRPSTWRPVTVLKIVVPLAVLVAMGFSTTWISGTNLTASGKQKFSAASYGRTEFPKVQSAIVKRAVPATTLAAALRANQAAATKKYAVPAPGAVGPEISVRFTGVAGKPVSGVYPVRVAGLPGQLLVRVQTGPAINGTDLRDAPGTIRFGQFTNQIDYQNAATALNQQMKRSVLARVDTSALAGKTISVTGAFQLINPNGWLVTPVKLALA